MAGRRAPVRGGASRRPAGPPSAVPRPAPAPARTVEAGRLTGGIQLVGPASGNDVAVAAGHHRRRSVGGRTDVRHRRVRKLRGSRVRSCTPQGRHVVCYIERAAPGRTLRSDAATFPKSVLGNVVAGLSRMSAGSIISQLSVIEPIMRARLEHVQAEGLRRRRGRQRRRVLNSTGFPLTAAEQLTYNEWLASDGACARDVDRSEERPPSGGRTPALLRLRARRGMLPGRRMRPARSPSSRRARRSSRSSTTSNRASSANRPTRPGTWR